MWSRSTCFWFAKNRGDLTTDFFPGIWQRLKPHGYRMHWGKLLSGDVAYLRRQYPRWDDFMTLRARMDPRQLFVSEYWRTQLEIASRTCWNATSRPLVARSENSRALAHSVNQSISGPTAACFQAHLACPISPWLRSRRSTI